jgi:hypothetical protein
MNKSTILADGKITKADSGSSYISRSTIPRSSFCAGRKRRACATPTREPYLVWQPRSCAFWPRRKRAWRRSGRRACEPPTC